MRLHRLSSRIERFKGSFEIVCHVDSGTPSKEWTKIEPSSNIASTNNDIEIKPQLSSEAFRRRENDSPSRTMQVFE